MCLKDMTVGQTCTFRVDSTFTKHDERAIQLTLHDVHTEAHVLDGQMLRRRVKSDGGKGNTANDGSAVRRGRGAGRPQMRHGVHCGLCMEQHTRRSEAWDEVCVDV